LAKKFLVTESDDGTRIEAPYEEGEAWQSVSTELRETNRLLVETTTQLRNQSEASSTLVPTLLETNANLTAQLQRMPGEVMEMVRPLLTPPVIAVVEPPPIETPLSDDSQTVVLESDGQKEAEVVDVTEIPPEAPPEKARRRFQPL
jgi:hypothetical protein